MVRRCFPSSRRIVPGAWRMSFSAAMIWGIFVATYSSIFICSPMLIYMGVRADTFDKMREKEIAGADVKAKEKA